jgi:probable rRNA maturation factor
MSRLLQIKNRQRTQRIAIRQLKKILVWALHEKMNVEAFELGIHLVGEKEMAAVNETFLQHEGSTDVITFNHSEIDDPTNLHGELYVCVDDAMSLAPRFRSTWQREVVRYCVHGCLHLQGYDDLEPTWRRKMKLRENQITRAVRKQFAVEKIDRNMGPPQ